MSASALQRLAAVAPRDLVRVTQSGRRLFHELLLQCRAAGLTAGPNSEHDVAHLHALFDIALQYGLGSLVYDYVVEVCSDKYCTSRFGPLFSGSPVLMLYTHGWSLMLLSTAPTFLLDVAVMLWRHTCWMESA